MRRKILLTMCLVPHNLKNVDILLFSNLVCGHFLSFLVSARRVIPRVISNSLMALLYLLAVYNNGLGKCI